MVCFSESSSVCSNRSNNFFTRAWSALSICTASGGPLPAKALDAKPATAPTVWARDSSPFVRVLLASFFFPFWLGATLRAEEFFFITENLLLLPHRLDSHQTVKR